VNFLNQKVSYILIIIISTIAITYLHYSTSLEAHALHGIYAELYYIPILIGAFLGFKAALITYLSVSALYLPFVFLSWSQSLFLADKILHLLFTGFFAFLAGYLIDKQRRYREQLEKDKIELRKLDKLKSSFLTNVSHELRTPMTSITGYTDLLLDKVDGPINEEQEKSLKKISSHSKHLLQLINDILDVSKMDSGEKIQLQQEELDMKLIVESVATTFKPIIKQKGLTLNVNIDKDLPAVYADEKRANQILINLLSNASKFTHEGGITINATTSKKGIKEGEPPLFIVICIEDTGIGMKEENLNKLFDKFSQIDPSIKRQYEGTGLGLNIVKHLVELHKGEIWVTSTEGKGSVFCFTLPLKKEL
jgi:signal transduction histidine kinase